MSKKKKRCLPYYAILHHAHSMGARCLTEQCTHSSLKIPASQLPCHHHTAWQSQQHRHKVGAVLIWALHIHRQSTERHQLHRVLKCLIEALQSEYVIASSDSRMKTTCSAAACCLLFKGCVQLIGWMLSPLVQRPPTEPARHRVIILILLHWLITMLAVNFAFNHRPYSCLIWEQASGEKCQVCSISQKRPVTLK